jgi:hypothetical protein
LMLWSVGFAMAFLLSLCSPLFTTSLDSDLRRVAARRWPGRGESCTQQQPPHGSDRSR